MTYSYQQNSTPRTVNRPPKTQTTLICHLIKTIYLCLQKPIEQEFETKVTLQWKVENMFISEPQIFL